MPYLCVKVSGSHSDEKTASIARLLTDHTADILLKKRELTAVTVEFIEQGQWFIGGDGCGTLPTFFLEIKVTEGTNTKDQKARYIREVFKSMETVLGELHPASYIVIQDLRGDSWGYDGLTQERRYIQSKNF